MLFLVKEIWENQDAGTHHPMRGRERRKGGEDRRKGPFRKHVATDTWRQVEVQARAGRVVAIIQEAQDHQNGTWSLRNYNN